MKIRSIIISKIMYRTSLARTDGEVIPLGTLAEFTSDASKRYLVLVCRDALSAKEREKLDWISDDLLKNPGDFFGKEIDAAISAKETDIFAYLAGKFAWSIYVSPATPMQISEPLMRELGPVLQKIEFEESKHRPIAAHGAIAHGALPVPKILKQIAGPDMSVDVHMPQPWVFAAQNRGWSYVD